MKQFAPLIFLLPLLCSLLMLPACQHPITPRPPTADTTVVSFTDLTAQLCAHPIISAVITTQAEYDALFAGSGDTLCRPHIDFTQYALLGQGGTSTGCEAPSITASVLSDNAHKQIVFTVHITRHGFCTDSAQYARWILVPKIAEGYGVVFKNDTSTTRASFQFTAVDVRPGDISFRLKVTVPRAPWILRIHRDGVDLFYSNPVTVATLDTIVFDPVNINPKETHTYVAYYSFDGVEADSSMPFTVTSGDTTSHLFRWDNFSIGTFSSSVKDVSIINDTSVWVAGEFFRQDSSGRSSLYNSARWNGTNWIFSTVADVAFNAIFGFSDSDIWAASSAPYHWDGTAWHGFALDAGIFNGNVVKIWGTSSSNLYIVGTNGAMARFDGTRWKKIESGTTLNIMDIWGSINEATGELEILATADVPFLHDQWKILKITGLTAVQLADSGIEHSPDGIWFVAGKEYYITGSLVYSTRTLEENLWWEFNSANYYSNNVKTSIRGNGLNDIAIACAGGDILHFNGGNWKNYRTETQLMNGYYNHIAMRGNLIVAVGEDDRGGAVAVGRR